MENTDVSKWQAWKCYPYTDIPDKSKPVEIIKVTKSEEGFTIHLGKYVTGVLVRKVK